MKLILVRHGETQANLALRWSGAQDLEITNLTETGRDQASKLGRWFKERRLVPTHIYSSPQKRALETAGLAGGHWGLPIKELEDLKETAAGIFEGLTWQEIEEQYPIEADQFRDTRDWVFIRGAESEETRRDRGKRVTRYLIEAHTNSDTVLAFAHAGIIQQIISAILEAPRIWGLSAKNTALYEFSINVDKWCEKSRSLLNPTEWRIIRFNEQPHLNGN